MSAWGEGAGNFSSMDTQRLMYAFHTQLRGRAFDLLGDSVVPALVRESLARRDEPSDDSYLAR